MNVKMLNHVSLDGDVIIKRGGAGSGGVTIHNQNKVVDIAENGTTEVVADSGYTGLGKVSVNVNVPTSGGGGGELEGEYYLARPSEWYWKIPAAWHHDNGFLRPDTDDYTNYTAIYTLGVDPLVYAYESVACVGNAQYRKYDIIGSARNSIEQHFRESIGYKIVFPVCAFRETKNSEGIDGVRVDSMVEELSIFTGEPEDVIIDFFANIGLLRITKEEYESLITE